MFFISIAQRAAPPQQQQRSPAGYSRPAAGSKSAPNHAGAGDVKIQELNQQVTYIVKSKSESIRHSVTLMMTFIGILAHIFHTRKNTGIFVGHKCHLILCETGYSFICIEIYISSHIRAMLL